VSNIVLATSTEATDTSDYVATDQSGLTSTSTHTVIIEPMVVPPATSPSGARHRLLNRSQEQRPVAPPHRLTLENP
jgi:hypothetical protein